MKQRRRVLCFLIVLFAITYLDRVCISVAGPAMQRDLRIDPTEWGWVTGIFMLAYCLFEIPAGAMGDRIGARRMLTRIVVWWSACTALTGMVSSLPALLLVRFCFGAGEAGAYPVSAVVISRWFPATRRATISGVTLMAGQLGGALAPLAAVPVRARYGWRAAFFLFAAVGLVWAIAWYFWFRDAPQEQRSKHANDLDVASKAAPSAITPAIPVFPWRAAVRSPSFRALVLAAFCYTYSYNFFQSWMHTFLVAGRGFDDTGLLAAALPFALAACATLAGGFISDALVRRLGATRGRRLLGMVGLTSAAVFIAAVLAARTPAATIAFLSLAYCSITFQQAGVLGVCLDIGDRNAGTMLGVVSMVSQLGGLLGSVAFGFIVEKSGSYEAPLIPMAILLCIAALLWTRIDASQQLEPQQPDTLRNCGASHVTVQT